MIIALWVITALFAAAFTMAGTMKVVTPYEKVRTNMTWVEIITPAQLKTIGVIEVIGAVGMILPAATGIAPWLTPAAAFGLALTMTVATLLHVRRREQFSRSLVLGVIALIIGISWVVFV